MAAHNAEWLRALALPFAVVAARRHMRRPLHQWRQAHSSVVHERKEKPGDGGGTRRHCGPLKLCSFVEQVLGPTCLTSRAGLRPSEVILRITRTMSVGQHRSHYVVGNVQPSLYVFKQLTLYVFNVLSSDSVRFARHCTFSKPIWVVGYGLPRLYSS